MYNTRRCPTLFKLCFLNNLLYYLFNFAATIFLNLFAPQLARTPVKGFYLIYSNRKHFIKNDVVNN